MKNLALKILIKVQSGLIWIITGYRLVILCILTVIATLYLAVTCIYPIRYLIFPENVSNQEFIKVVQDNNSNTIKVSAASLLERPESNVYDELHKMANTKILAEQIWGEIPITKEKVNALIIEISNFNYNDKDILLVMLYNWKKGDFSNTVGEHNYLWEQLGGTVGKAYGLR